MTVDRREFLRLAALLGAAGYVGAGAAAGVMPFPAADPKAKRGGVYRQREVVGLIRSKDAAFRLFERPSSST